MHQLYNNTIKTQSIVSVCFRAIPLVCQQLYSTHDMILTFTYIPMPFRCTRQITKQTTVLVIILVHYSTSFIISTFGFAWCPIGFIHCAVITYPPPTSVFVFG